jgi:hypothetical protein
MSTPAGKPSLLVRSMSVAEDKIHTRLPLRVISFLFFLNFAAELMYKILSWFSLWQYTELILNQLEICEF